MVRLYAVQFVYSTLFKQLEVFETPQNTYLLAGLALAAARV
jgi:hypothetical protein